MAQRAEAVERAHERIAADRVVGHAHALAAGDLADAGDEILAAIEDRVLTAVPPGDLGLLGAADGADHLGADVARPLAQQEPHATGRGMHEDAVSGLDRMHAMDQEVGGQALDHDGSGRLVVDCVGQPDQKIGLDQALAGIAAVAGRKVGDAIAGAHGGHSGPDGLDDARSLQTGDAGKAQRPVKTRPHVAVMEIDADGGLPDAGLTRAGRGNGDGLGAQHLRSAGLAQHDGFGHDVPPSSRGLRCWRPAPAPGRR